ncbi:MAG: membrane protein insertion efficiency factor YidD [bacterium]|nr:membrane protein insertion efficiency factor YidD [bacterium]
MLVQTISLYQATLSPDHGPLKSLHTYGYCRHHPTCSQYAKEEISRRGAVIGIMQASKRILSCNPFVKPSKEKLRIIAKIQ